MKKHMGLKKTCLNYWLLFHWLLSHPLHAGYHEQGYQFISPVPGAKYTAPQSTIIIRFDTVLPDDLVNGSTLITVTGDESGNHLGETVIAGDKKTIIFKPASSFLPGETVLVSLTPILREPIQKEIQSLQYRFEISRTAIQRNNQIVNESAPDPPFKNQKSHHTTAVKKAMIMENGVSVPGDFPHVNVTVNDHPDSGFVFLNNWGPPNYIMIFENSGAPFWYYRSKDWDRRRDFKVQPNGWLTMLIRGGYGKPEKDQVSNWGFIALDSYYNHIKTFRASNGYFTDDHELKVLSNGGYLLIGRMENSVDMSQYISGGRTDAVVIETCIQEYAPDDELIFQWRAWDHFDIRDLQLTFLFGNSILFPHMNAIDIDEDGHILLSSRNLSEVTKIHRQTGEIIWRLGGPNNQFTFLKDGLKGFILQHDIRALGNNRYTIFDNGDLHNPPLSRAVEYELDTDQMTATLVWEFANDHPFSYSYYMGNAQRLSNGNTLINWGVGTLPKATEVQPNGEKVFEMWFVDGYHTYRTFRFPWQGMRLTPYLIIEPEIDQLALLFNKFGDTNVDYYNIYSGPSPNPTALFDTSKLTLKRFNNFVNGERYFFRVTAVDKKGEESDYSNEENILINIDKSGENLITNGNFSDTLNHWNFGTEPSAQATLSFPNQTCHFKIDQGGSSLNDIQLRQNNITLIHGETYIISFDAWADESRTMEVKVGKDNSPWINYGKYGMSYVTNNIKHFHYPFVMEDQTDENSRIEINVGLHDADVTIDNVTLVLSNGSNRVEDSSGMQMVESSIRNFPNPFNFETKISFEIKTKSQSCVKIYNLKGQVIQTILDQYLPAGEHTIIWDGTDYHGDPVSSGLYLCHVHLGNFQKTIRMVVLR